MDAVSDTIDGEALEVKCQRSIRVWPRWRHPLEYASAAESFKRAAERLPRGALRDGAGSGSGWTHAPLSPVGRLGDGARESYYRPGASLALLLRLADPSLQDVSDAAGRLCWSSNVVDDGASGPPWRIKFSMAPPCGPPDHWTLAYTAPGRTAMTVRLGSVYEAVAPRTAHVLAEFHPRDLKGRRVSPVDELKALAKSPAGLMWTANSRLAELQWRVAEAGSHSCDVSVAEARRLEQATGAIARHAEAFHLALVDALRVIWPDALERSPEAPDGPGPDVDEPPVRRIRLG